MKTRKVLTMIGGVPLYVHHPEAVHEVGGRGPVNIRAVQDETDKISKYIREIPVAGTIMGRQDPAGTTTEWSRLLRSGNPTSGWKRLD